MDDGLVPQWWARTSCPPNHRWAISAENSLHSMTPLPSTSSASMIAFTCSGLGNIPSCLRTAVISLLSLCTLERPPKRA